MNVENEIKQFIGLNSRLNVDIRDNIVHITGYYDDLDPEPQRSKIGSKLDRLELQFRKCDPDKFSFSIEKVYSIERSYGQIKLNLKIET